MIQKKNKSFINKVHEKAFNAFIDENLDNRNRIFITNYQIFDLSNFILQYYPTTKSVRKLDFMTFCPHELGLQFLVTNLVYNIISKFKLPIHNKITVKINTFEDEYFLIGFPMLEVNSYDFEKSTFFDYKNGKNVKYIDAEDYETAEYSRNLAKPLKLCLNSQYDYDIINTTKGIYFSSDIIEEFKKENITGYKIIEGILET